MAFIISVQSEALLDLKEAFEWYELQQPSLGYQFINEIEAGFKRICDYPLYYSAINNRFRRLKVNRFPYLIIYEIEGTTIFVIAVRHISQRPI